MRKFFRVALSILFGICFYPSAYALDLNQNPDVRAYIEKLSVDYNFDINELENWFGQMEFDERTIQKETAPVPVPHNTGQLPVRRMGVPWYIYRDKHVTQKRIAEGKTFWQANSAFLKLTEKTYGVSAGVITGIIGLETNFGADEGNYSALSALSTYAFRIPRREPYFRKELTCFLLLCRAQKWDPLQIRSSVDGGLGMPQFMPSSYRSFAIPSAPKSASDLFNNPHDAIASVANYLKQNGWKNGEPVAIPAKVEGNNYAALLNETGKVHFTIGELANYGIVPSESIPSGTRAGVAFLKYKDHIAPWIFFHNFAVIKTYNNSTNYALTVYTLGERIRPQFGKNTTIENTPTTVHSPQKHKKKKAALKKKV